MTPEQSVREAVLSESARHRYLLFGALYFVQGLPFGLLVFAVPAWLAKQGKKEAARQMLADIYNWFTEGFDTADLKEAKARLNELSR